MSRKVMTYKEWWNVMDSEDTEFRKIPFDEKSQMYDSYVKHAVEASEAQAYGNDCPGGQCDT